MIKLLNAGFTRLCKSKIFWMLIMFSIGFSLFGICSKYVNFYKYNETVEIGQLLLIYPVIIGIIIAIFTSLFVGIEYSDGAMRNKITIGHKRINIYLSYLIITSIASILFYVISIAVTLAIGITLFGIGTIPIKVLMIKIFVNIMVCIAFSSIYTFVVMLCSNKTITAITTIIISLFFMFFATYCYSILETPPYIETAKINDQATGQYEFVQEPNPKYPSEEKKRIFQTLLDINPTGQTIQMLERESKLGVLQVYSLGIIIVFTTLGLVLFEQKELK